VVEHPTRYPIIEANHPIYIGFGWLFYDAIRHFAAVRALTVLQWLNSIFAAMSVCLIYLLGEKLFESSLAAILLAAIFATAATWWKFATDANAYIPAIFFLLAAAWVLLSSVKARPIEVAIIHLSAMLFHQLAVLFFIPAAVALYLHSASQDRKVRIRTASIYVTSVATLTLAAYYACYYLATGGTAIAGYLSWIIQHTPDSAFSFAPGANLMFTLRGTLRVFLGGSVNLLRSGPLAITAVLGLFALGFVWTWRNSGESPPRKRPAFPKIVLLIWIGVYAGFLFFWMPRNTFYRLFYLAPLVLLLGPALSRPKFCRIAYTMFGLAASWNFLFYIYPHSRAETNRVLSSASAMHSLWKPGTVVYEASFNTDNWIVSYFNPQAEFKTLEAPRLSQIDSELLDLRQAGRAAWLDRSAIDSLRLSATGEAWLQAHSKAGFERDFSDGKHRISFLPIFPLPPSQIP
jgi:hypothetical protein